MEIIALLLAGVFSAGLGAVVVIGSPKRAISWYFLGTTLATMLWAIGVALFLYLDNPAQLKIVAQIYYIAAASIAFFTLLTMMTVGVKRRTKLKDLLYTIPGLMIIGTLLFNQDWLINEVNSEGNNTAQLNTVPYLIYAIYFITYYLIALVHTYLRYRRTTSRQLRRQLLYILHAFGWAGLVGSIFNLLLPGLGNYDLIWVGPLGLFVFVPIVYFDIAKHHLFDLKSAVVRTVAYVFSLTTLSLVYFALAYLASLTLFDGSVSTDVSVSPLNIVLALVLAFIFQPIKEFFDRFTNRLFYRDRYDTDEFIENLGKALTSTTVLADVLRNAAIEIATTLKSSSASFMVYHENGAEVISDRLRSVHLTQNDCNELKNILGDNLIGSVIIIDFKSKAAKYKKISRFVFGKNTALALSLGEDIGYLFLGEQKTGSFSKRDIHVLETVANELVIAIHNARSVEEVQDLNTGLKKRIDEATRELRLTNRKLMELDKTKDEFISMASHQLRTPLTSVKGYISMVLEGDVGKISADQRKLLEEAFASSERMVHLIGDFLNVSRLQTGKFVLEKRLTDTGSMIEEEVESMRQMGQLHGIRIDYRRPKTSPQLYIDDGKLRQVIMNFIDNAIYYSPEKASIKVSSSVEDGDLLFTVKDSGIGVPAEAQARLFTKFFRAENARTQRPDGTGVGLFLAKKVILEHGGSLVFESTEGKGSIFGFRLPIKKLSDAPGDKSE